MSRPADPCTAGAAPRVELTGSPSRIHVSEATYQLVAGGFPCEKRPLIEVKGKAAMQTYLVIGRRPLAERAASDSTA